jgi:hypothetical protein
MTRIITLSAVALMCSTGLALAADNPSGRPGKVLNEDQCQQAWQAAGPSGDTLSEAAASPYVLNFKQVDTSNDRQISKDEWQAACNTGWVSADARNVTAKDTAGSEANNMMDENQSQ